MHLWILHEAGLHETLSQGERGGGERGRRKGRICENVEKLKIMEQQVPGHRVSEEVMMDNKCVYVCICAHACTDTRMTFGNSLPLRNTHISVFILK